MQGIGWSGVSGRCGVKPPMPYYGGKTTIGARISDLFPPHDHYVEPFAGSLAVLLAKKPSRMETVNDLDQRLMTFWRVLRERPTELQRYCALTPHSRAEHDAAYEDSDDELEQARRVWVCLAQGRAGTLKKTGWRYYIDPAGSSTSMPGYLAGYVDRIAAAVERLSAVSLECRPALDVIKAYGAQPKALLYVDPPYLGSTRMRNYRLEMPAEADHRELAAVLSAAKSAVVLSGYHSPLYDELYDGWYRREIETMTGQANEWQQRTEVLWSNRPFAGAEFLFGDDLGGAA
jgi:DNA adenine methylase